MGHCKDKVGADEKASAPGEVSATIAKAEIAVAVVRIFACIIGVKDFNGIAKIDLVKELQLEIYARRNYRLMYLLMVLPITDKPLILLINK
jgi:hypothetical protein